MYEYLSGKLAEKKPTHAVLDVGGIGFSLTISLATYSALPDAGEPCSLYAYLHVREDAQLLFGFSTKEERDIFLKLLSISGIGPRLAVTILSGMGVAQLCDAIAQDNVLALTNIPGIGKKTAQRLIIELKEKIGRVSSAVPAGGALTEGTLVDDALSALMALGYKKPEAAKALQAAYTKQPNATVEELIRETLGQMK